MDLHVFSPHDYDKVFFMPFVSLYVCMQTCTPTYTIVVVKSAFNGDLQRLEIWKGSDCCPFCDDRLV
jgi:hypothetical protein